MTSRAVLSWLFAYSSSGVVRLHVQSCCISRLFLWMMILFSAMYMALLTAGVCSANVSRLLFSVVLYTRNCLSCGKSLVMAAPTLV